MMKGKNETWKYYVLGRYANLLCWLLSKLSSKDRQEIASFVFADDEFVLPKNVVRLK